jgi:hypothetical protein
MKRFMGILQSSGGPPWPAAIQDVAGRAGVAVGTLPQSLTIARLDAREIGRQLAKITILKPHLKYGTIPKSFCPLLS